MSLELIPADKLTRDLRKASATLNPDEARFLVDTYNQQQEERKRAGNQVRALAESGEPHDTIAFFFDQFSLIEKEIAKSLDTYSAAQPLGEWARSILGIGPVIAAGLLAHIDVARAPTAGAVWRYAGLDPSSKWEKGQKRPWNASLKVLCWKIGDSFVKVSGNEKSLYGRMYRERKVFEVERDLSGGHAAAAAETLQTRKIVDPATRKVYESGHLPAGRLDLRARRYAVKLFLAHYHEVGRRQLGLEVPAPYPLAHQGHTHRIEPPNFP